MESEGEGEGRMGPASPRSAPGLALLGHTGLRERDDKHKVSTFKKGLCRAASHPAASRSVQCLCLVYMCTCVYTYVCVWVGVVYVGIRGQQQARGGAIVDSAWRRRAMPALRGGLAVAGRMKLPQRTMMIAQRQAKSSVVHAKSGAGKVSLEAQLEYDEQAVQHAGPLEWAAM